MGRWGRLPQKIETRDWSFQERTYVSKDVVGCVTLGGGVAIHTSSVEDGSREVSCHFHSLGR